MEVDGSIRKITITGHKASCFFDLKALEKYDDYSRARDRMRAETDRPYAPWVAVLANDKRRARLNVIRSVLHRLDYEGKDPGRIGSLDDRIVFDAPGFLARGGDL